MYGSLEKNLKEIIKEVEAGEAIKGEEKAKFLVDLYRVKIKLKEYKEAKLNYNHIHKGNYEA